jgi:hypothetical protein
MVTALVGHINKPFGALEPPQGTNPLSLLHARRVSLPTITLELSCLFASEFPDSFGAGYWRNADRVGDVKGTVP